MGDFNINPPSAMPSYVRASKSTLDIQENLCPDWMIISTTHFSFIKASSHVPRTCPSTSCLVLHCLSGRRHCSLTENTFNPLKTMFMEIPASFQQ